MKTLPTLEYELEAADKGYELIIGVDEVGRGALAGPVVAGAVCLTGLVSSSRSRPLCPVPSAETAFTRAAKRHLRQPTALEENKNIDWGKIGIDDSKRLTAKKREELAIIIKEYAAWGIGEASVATINRIGIVKATEKAMRSAIAQLNKMNKVNKVSNLSKTFLLIDGKAICGRSPQASLIKGDQKSISIAAASIIAKVHRDKIMREFKYKFRFKEYGWEKNKGYGTRKHLAAIKKYGVSKLHREGWTKED